MAAFASLSFRYSSIAVQFLTVAIVTNALQKDEAGWYFMLLGLILSTYFLFGFGIPDGIVCTICRNERPSSAQEYRIISQGLWFSTLMTAPFLACAALVGMNSCGLHATICCLIWWLSYAVLFFCSQCMVAIGRKSEGAFFFYGAATWSSCVVIVPYMLLSISPSFNGLLVMTICGVAPCAIFAMVRLFIGFSHVKDQDESHFSPTVIQVGLPICLSRVAQTTLYWIPVWVVGFSLSANQAGDFAIASRLAIATNAFIAAIRFIVRPRLSNARNEENKKSIEALTRVIATFATLFVLIVLISNMVLGQIAITEIFGSQYSQASVILTFLLLGTACECFGGPVDEILKMSGFERKVLIAYVLAVAFEALICLLMVPAGTIAVALSQAITLLLLFGWFSLRVYKDLDIFVGAHLAPTAFFASLREIRPESA